MSSGAVDPLSEIAAVCKEHNMWFHDFHTDIPDIEALPEIVVRLGKTLDRLLRPPMLRGQNSADSSQAG